MGKRKIYFKSSAVEAKKLNNREGTVEFHEIRPETVGDSLTISISLREGGARAYSFAQWYGIGFDDIVDACRKQIVYYQQGRGKIYEPASILSFCQNGLESFFRFLSLKNQTSREELSLRNVDRVLIDEYILYLGDSKPVLQTQQGCFSSTKAVLKGLVRRKLVLGQQANSDRLFPRNPFPGALRTVKGERPLTKRERQDFANAVKRAVLPLFDRNTPVTSELLSYALLVVALHTGRNTGPLIELTSDCLKTHPKPGMMSLVLYKRRSRSISSVPVRGTLNHDVDSIEAIRPNVGALLLRVIEAARDLKDDAPEHLQDRVWLFRRQKTGRTGGGVGQISAVSSRSLPTAISKLVTQFNLRDVNGERLRINVSRLRKTFTNRVYEILDGDVINTAVAAGNTPKVLERNYLRVTDESIQNWRFLGKALVLELLTGTLGASERTPVGQCSDSQAGQYSPKVPGSHCMSFFNCFRCANYVVTEQDLYRLFSFYWRVLGERKNMNAKRWRSQFNHILRIIDTDIIAAGLARSIFSLTAVESARERARVDPHPYWAIGGTADNFTAIVK